MFEYLDLDLLIIDELLLLVIASLGNLDLDLVCNYFIEIVPIGIVLAL